MGPIVASLGLSHVRLGIHVVGVLDGVRLGGVRHS